MFVEWNLFHARSQLEIFRRPPSNLKIGAHYKNRLYWILDTKNQHFNRFNNRKGVRLANIYCTLSKISSVLQVEADNNNYHFLSSINSQTFNIYGGMLKLLLHSFFSYGKPLKKLAQSAQGIFPNLRR